MRVISKKIVYDSLSSKLPGIIPSIMNSWTIPPIYSCGEHKDGETYYSHETAIKRAAQYNINASQLEYKAQFVQFDKNNLIEFTVGNYGLIPSDVIIPKEIADTITDYTDIYVNIPDGNGGFYDLSWPKNSNDPHYEGRKIISGGTEVKILTYYTLNKWYSFFRNYYDLINHPSYSRYYENAIDYYNKEYVVKNDERKSYYQELDDIFNSRGGKKMYDWISNNCIVQYQIPDEYSDEWNTTYLYYPDAIKWYYWFKEKSEQFKYVSNLEDCQTVDLNGGTCCDCVEFVKLGGHGFYNRLKEWVDSVNINPEFATNSASVTIPITILSSIDDLGEMAIFSSKWKEEQDYHNTLNSGENGTIMNTPHVKYYRCKQCGYEAPEADFNGKCHRCNCTSIEYFDADIEQIYMIKPGSDTKGYEYNEYYENEFKSSNWISYTDYYINQHPDEFISKGVAQNGQMEDVSSFTYSPINGKVIYNPTDITEDIKVNKIPDVCINGITYDVIDGKYVELCYSTDTFADLKYRKHTKLQIFKDGDIEYTVYNGKRKYVETDTNDPTQERVYFLRELNCHDDGCVVKEGKYIVFDNCLYLVEDNKITVEESGEQRIYPLLDGYFDIKDNRFYISGNSVVVQDLTDYDAESDIYNFKFRELNDDELRVFNLIKIVVSEDKTFVTLYYYYVKSDCRVISGYSDSKLDTLRRKEITTDDLGNELPGYFRPIVSIDGGANQSKYNLPYDECTLDILYKVGEVSDLKHDGFSETRFIGNILTDIRFYYADEFRNPIIEHTANNDNALEVIQQCENELKNSNNDKIIDVLFCDITYHIGAVIDKVGDKYILDTAYHTGVKYVDTVYVTKQVGTFYLNDDRQFTFKYYLLSQDVDTISVTDFNADLIWDASTYFEIEPLLRTSSGIYDFSKFGNFSSNNGVVSAPLFRNEFNLASSMSQNIKADIYIDRGISAAYERLLKLQEFRTMEALENYGNGFYKINEY